MSGADDTAASPASTPASVVVGTGTEPHEARAARDRHVVRAVAWTGMGRYAGQIFRWGTTLVVARILSPSDYGLVGMTALFSGFVALLAEFGVGTAVVRMRHLDDEQLAQMNGLAVCLGLAAALVSLAAAYPLSLFFRRPELVGIVAVSAIGFVASSLQTIPLALLQRNMEFKAIAAVEVVGAMLLALGTLLLALNGAGYWSLVFPSLIVGLVNGLRFRRRARVGFAIPRLAQLREAYTFSAWVIGGRLAGYVYASADFLTVGRVLGSGALGSYTFAWDLSNAPNDQINGLVARVSSSFYSAVQHDREEMARLLMRFLEAVSCVSVPLVIGMAVVAPEFVAVALGPKWVNAVAPLQILCVFAALRVVNILLVPVLSMIGDVKYVTTVTTMALIYLPLLFFVAAKLDGGRGVAIAWLIGYPPMACLLFVRAQRQLNFAFGSVFRALLPAVTATCGMVVAVVAARGILNETVPLPVRLGALVLTGAAGYLMVLLVFFRGRLRSFKEILVGAMGRRGPVNP